MAMRAVRWVIPILLLAPACGGDDDAASEDEQLQPITDEVSAGAEGEQAPADDVADDDGDDERSDGSEEATAADVDDTGTEFSGASDSEWCDTARDIDALVDRLDAEDFNVADPAAVEEAFSSIVSELEAASDIAPDEIADDVRTTLQGFSTLTDELAGVDWDFLDADLTIIEELDTEMDTSSDRIGRYNEQVCGIPFDDDDATASADDDGAFDPSAGTAREQMEVGLVELGFTAEESACIVDNVDIAGYMASNDDDIIVAAFDACEIPISRLVELGEG